MTNILEAIYNIINHNNFAIRGFYSGRNRANSMGAALENYVKDAFADTLGMDNEGKRLELYNEKFSWLGSQNNPPDLMIKYGDAIEVKKTQSANSSLALNSSFPKSELTHKSPMITSECRSCEDWERKDLIYFIGHASDEKLESLWIVYGNIYAAKQETYQRIKTTISEGIKQIPDVVFSDTKELGRVNQVDPLGITNLRIRGMWQIENPRKVFNYLHESKESEFELVCIIPLDNYNALPEISRVKVEKMKQRGLSIEDKQVKNPNNPAKLIACKLIKYII